MFILTINRFKSNIYLQSLKTSNWCFRNIINCLLKVLELFISKVLCSFKAAYLVLNNKARNVDKEIMNNQQ